LVAFIDIEMLPGLRNFIIINIACATTIRNRKIRELSAPSALKGQPMYQLSYSEYY
jgi:hypothetical protein